MSVEWVIGLVGGVLALIFGGVGWWRIEGRGEERAERKQAERERDAAIEDAEAASRPPLSGPQSVFVLHRLRDRKRRR